MSTAAIAAPGYHAPARRAGGTAHAGSDRIRTAYDTYGALPHSHPNQVVQGRRPGAGIVPETATGHWRRCGLYDPIRGSV
jgi:hypothetical protein